MSHPAISVDNISKLYRIGTAARSSSFREVIASTFASAMRRVRGFGEDRNQSEEFWALRDVSFEIQPGEAVGIIGRNGAGKSTLLKILSRITEPTQGTARLRGRVASLLEVGTGFHPDLTGRENIYLNGSILGMKRAEITRKFDEIVEFSEVQRFLDTPVKRYSSGMYVRLAFAVAAHLEPEILLVDEVLAVGDLEFQRKCLGKMNDVVNHGRTVFFVSHSMSSIVALTSRCLVMKGGRLLMDAPTDQAIRTFIEMSMLGATGQSYTNDNGDPDSNYLAKVRVLTSGSVGLHEWGKPIVFEFIMHVGDPRDDLGFSFIVFDRFNRATVNFWVYSPEAPFRKGRGVYRLRCEIPKFRLYMGQYTITTYIQNGASSIWFENLTEICPFEVIMGETVREERPWHENACCYLEDGEWAPIVQCDPA